MYSANYKFYDDEDGKDDDDDDYDVNCIYYEFTTNNQCDTAASSYLDDRKSAMQRQTKITKRHNKIIVAKISLPTSKRSADHYVTRDAC